MSFRDKKTDPQDIPFTLPKIGRLPPEDKWVMSEISKKLYKEGAKAKPGEPKGQGFAYIAWIMDGVAHVELVPAFNIGDGKNEERKSYPKYDPTTDVCAINTSVESEGSKTHRSVIHQHAFDVLKKSGRIPADITLEDTVAGSIFEGEGLQDNEKNAPAIKHLSHYINSKSVLINKELKLASYFDPPPSISNPHSDAIRIAEETFKREYYVSRGLFTDIGHCVEKTFERELGVFINYSLPLFEEAWWKRNQENFFERNRQLMYTLTVAILIKPDILMIEGILECMQTNLERNKQPPRDLCKLLDTEYKNEESGIAEDNLLISAVKNKLCGTQIVNILIEHKANINLPNSEGDTALIIAAREGSIDKFRLLLDAEAKINSINHVGKSVFSVAIESENYNKEIILLLLGKKDIPLKMVAQLLINIKVTHGEKDYNYFKQKVSPDVAKVLLQLEKEQKRQEAKEQEKLKELKKNMERIHRHIQKNEWSDIYEKLLPNNKPIRYQEPILQALINLYPYNFYAKDQIQDKLEDMMMGMALEPEFTRRFDCFKELYFLIEQLDKIPIKGLKEITNEAYCEFANIDLYSKEITIAINEILNKLIEKAEKIGSEVKSEPSQLFFDSPEFQAKKDLDALIKQEREKLSRSGPDIDISSVF